MMKERPILFSTSMVKAILADEKTKTRRVVKPQPLGGCLLRGPNSYGTWEPYTGRPDIDEDAGACAGRDEWVCPYGKPGDRLWVRETWRPAVDENLFCCVEYRADGMRIKPVRGSLTEDQGHRFADDCPDDPALHSKWRPSIFMPRWASRITLEVVSVKVERVQDITPDDCRAEGMPQTNTDIGVRYSFGQLWNAINAKRGYGWDVNPWVWVVEFKRVTK